MQHRRRRNLDTGRSAATVPVIGMLAAVTVAASGCDPVPAEHDPPPCPGAPASRIELGRPSIGFRDATTHVPPQAVFTTPGGPVHVTVYGFDHNVIFGDHAMGSAVYVGPAGTPPTVDPADGRVITTVTAQVSVGENSWQTLTLPAGRYWLISSNYADVDIVSCDRILTGPRNRPCVRRPHRPCRRHGRADRPPDPMIPRRIWRGRQTSWVRGTPGRSTTTPRRMATDQQCVSR